MLQEQYGVNTWLPDLPRRPNIPKGKANSDGTLCIKQREFDDFCAQWQTREDALFQRIEGLAFHPDESLAALKNQMGTDSHVDQALGVRLLQKVHALTIENDDLAARLTEVIETLAAERNSFASQHNGIY
jgi:hypothetical protein